MNPEQSVATALLRVVDALEHLVAYTSSGEEWERAVARRALEDARGALTDMRPVYDAEALMMGEVLGDRDDDL